MIRKMLLLVSLSFLIVSPISAQNENDSIRKARKQEADSTVVIGKDKVVYRGRIYRQNAPYVTLAYGLGYGFDTRLMQQSMTLAYHHYINRVGLRIGYHAASDLPPWWRSYQKLNDFFLGVGTRWDQSPRWNLAIYAGPSLAYGWYIAFDEVRQEDRAYGFMTAGGHAEAQVTYRLAYDLGLGLSVYGSVNKYYSVTGAQVHLFFSTAFIRNYD